MKNFKAGQKVRVVGNSFTPDPHDLEIGKVYTIDRILPPCDFNEFDPFTQLMMVSVNGGEPFDVPQRALIYLEDGEHSNATFEDLEVVEEEESFVFRAKMIEECWVGGYAYGDVVEVFHEGGALYFLDRDGDTRPLEGKEYEVVS